MSGALEEHFSYIADAVRTERFRQAIARVIEPGDVAVDLGCGFGLLGILCLQAGAARVWGIDQTEAIEIARETAQRAGFVGRYQCIRESSFRGEIPEKADVLICDHVGYFGFDYGIIDMLGDARRRMLKPGGTIMPQSLTIFVAGIESAACGKNACGWVDPAIPKEFHWLKDHGVNSKYPYKFAVDELATGAGAFCTVDLRSENAERIGGTAEVEATRDSELVGIGGWFEAELAPAVTMTNSPLDAAAINRDQLFLPFDRALEVQSSDAVRIRIDAHHSSNIISWIAENLRTGERRSQTTWKSKILAPEDVLHPEARVPRLSKFGTATQVLARLIDGKRTARQIEDEVAAHYPDLLPSEAEVRHFVRCELARIAKCH